MQQGEQVRLVVDPRSGGEEVDERDLPDEVVGSVTGPGEERAVRLEDETVGVDAQVPAGCAFVELDGVVDEERAFEGCSRLVLADDVRPSS